MSWTTMTDRSAGDVISEADWDAFQGNIEYLLNPNADLSVYDNGSDYTATDTSFVDINTANISATITTNGGPVLVLFQGVLSASGGTAVIALDIDVDGTRHGNAGADGIWGQSVGSGNREPVNLHVVIDGLAAGSHTFKMQWKTDANSMVLRAGAGVGGTDYVPVINAIEI